MIDASYRKYVDQIGRPPAPMLRDYIEAVEMGVLWVAGEPVVGLISLVPESESTLSIENLAVLPTAQRSGIGRQLMEFAEHRARELGLRRLSLYTNEAMTENLTLYPHLGFAEVDRRQGDGYHRVYFEKALDPT